MTKYKPSDDGKTIDGKVVVFLHPETAAEAAAEKEPASAAASAPNKLAAAKVGSAKSQAATLKKAAKDGKPFCEHCEAARKKLAAMGKKK